MYVGVGRKNSPNNGGPDHEISPDIPEWKKQLILKKRAAGGSCGSHVFSANEESKPPTPSSYDPARPRVPLSPANEVKNGPCHPNKYAVVRPVKVENTEGEKLVIPFSISAGENSFLASNTVTRIFGNINVELRNVNRSNSEPVEHIFDPHKMEGGCYPSRLLLSPSSEPAYAPQDSEEESDDLQYGPGIVDKLRSRFLNMGRKSQRKPVVRRFSSLENLSDRNEAACRKFLPNSSGVSPGNNKQLFRTSAPCNLKNNNYPVGNVKKAQSMETLLIGNPEQHMLIANKPSRRVAPRSACTSGVRSQIARATAPSSPVTVGEISPACANKINRRRTEYSRQVSASSINEDELPKPDTVKHFKKIFESPTVDKTCSVLRKSVSPSPPTSVNKYPGAISCNTPVKMPEVCKLNDSYSANLCANSNLRKTSHTVLNGGVNIEFDDSSEDISKDVELSENDFENPSLAAENCELIASEKIKVEEIIWDSLSQSQQDGNDLISSEEVTLSNDHNTMLSACLLEETDEGAEELKTVDSPQQVSPPLSPKVTILEEEEEEEEEPSQEYEEKENEPAQGDEVSEPERQTAESNTKLHPETELLSHRGGMVVASQDGDSSSPDNSTEMCVLQQQARSPTNGNGDVMTLKPSALKKPVSSTWQKPPPSTTSVVFDFRGKDVKPNISLNPAPFGCRPAKVARNKKRAGSPPRTNDTARTNGGDPQKDYSDEEDADDDGFDEMDIGAHLPTLSGILFDGENIKIGKGSLLLQRNKNLTIQFDDSTTSTYEYPSEATAEEEMTSPETLTNNTRLIYETDDEINGPSKFKSTLSGGSSGGLSSYTPNVLSSEKDFQLGLSQSASSYRHIAIQPTKSEFEHSSTDDIVPADSEDITGWSAAETSDILF